MFSVGDKVVYPMHGAGTIQNIEEKEVLGETRAYYILRIPYGNLQVMVPVQGSDAAGLRPIVSDEVVEDVFGVLSAEREGDRTPYAEKQSAESFFQHSEITVFRMCDP